MFLPALGLMQRLQLPISRVVVVAATPRYCIRRSHDGKVSKLVGLQRQRAT